MMTTTRFFATLVPVLVIACGGGGGSNDHTGTDAGPPSDAASPIDGAHSTANNTVPMVVNAGPANADDFNVPFISVTICAPGTSTCATIDDVSVDTGSTGLRLIASALPSGFTLPQAKASNGSALAECYTFDDGYIWGSVRSADVKIGGEVATSTPIHLVGDPAFASVPAACAATGQAEDTVAAFGANGLIGINQIFPDCGSACSGSSPASAAYYSCSGSACKVAAVADADQVTNPIAVFSSDDNGAVLQFPSVPASGQATLTGSLTFGIGTQSDNDLGSATVMTVDDEGNLTTVYKGQTLSMSYIDSGTTELDFTDSITQCTGDNAGFYCPSSTLGSSAENKGVNGVTTTVDFSVANANTLFDTNDTAFSNIAATGTAGTFAWGFPIFIGRSVFIALQGKSTPSGTGPYVAY
jgi:hypothetical protein